LRISSVGVLRGTFGGFFDFFAGFGVDQVDDGD